MSLAPLLSASPAIQVHAFAAIVAFILGGLQFVAPKGTLPHRAIGWAWVALMLVVAVSAFLIQEIRLVGAWSPIHLLSILVLVMTPLAVLHARRHRVSAHRKALVSLFLGARLIAGILTFMPGRIMHAVLFGG